MPASTAKALNSTLFALGENHRRQGAAQGCAVTKRLNARSVSPKLARPLSRFDEGRDIPWARSSAPRHLEGPRG
jgi:hypothetical protein